MKKEVTIKEGNISLIIDSYDDIFSDFDPRPLGRRALSGDFLEECRNAARDKPKKGVELRLLVPRALRKVSDEHLIRKRLREHFRKHHSELAQQQRSIRLEGARWVLLGIAFSMLAVALVRNENGVWTTLLLVIAEPAGWFSFWTGLDKLFLEPRKHTPEHDFYEKMENAEIIFESY